jgi:hypothetical protein
VNFYRVTRRIIFPLLGERFDYASEEAGLGDLLGLVSVLLVVLFGREGAAFVYLSGLGVSWAGVVVSGDVLCGWCDVC